jgi:hypothetical protein
MTEENQRDELADYYENSRKPLFRMPKHPLGRLACGLVLIVWFLFLLLPCAMIYLAMGNPITIPNGSIPEPEQHPRFGIQLIMEIENRGLKLSSSSIASETETRLCIENRATYLLWEKDETATDSQFCQCYERSSADAAWNYIEQYEGQCE